MNAIKLCQICHSPHDGSYGSGRFCDAQCAAKSRRINRAKTIAKKKRLGLYRKNFKPNTSKLQKKISQLLIKAGIPHQTQYQIGRYYFDIRIGKTLLQVNGDFWHCNPKMYKSTQIVKFPGQKRILAMNVWKKDLKKRLEANKKGFKVVYLWQNQINNSTQAILLKRINEIIKNNNNSVIEQEILKN